jgi:hypothetical protein
MLEALGGSSTCTDLVVLPCVFIRWFEGVGTTRLQRAITKLTPGGSLFDPSWGLVGRWMMVFVHFVRSQEQLGKSS